MANHLTAHDKVEDVEDSGLRHSQKHMPFGAGLQTFFSQQLYFLKSLLSKDVSSGSIAPTNGPHSFRKRALLPCSQEESIALVSMNHEVRSHQIP